MRSGTSSRKIRGLRTRSCSDRAQAARKARAILEYLDFQPIEELFARGVLDAAAHGR
jgi:hypothetical protein